MLKKRGNKVKDLKGKIFGRLKVLEFSHNLGAGKGAVWKCSCTCGNFKLLRAKVLLGGNSRSCGCLAKEFQKRKRKSNEEVSLNYHYSIYQRGAESRNLDFNISKEEFNSLVKQNCYYCSSEPKPIMRSRGRKAIGNGLDRIDSSKGYLKDNVVPCCKMCNIMKWNLSKSEFKNQIERIYLTFVKDDK